MDLADRVGRGSGVVAGRRLGMVGGGEMSEGRLGRVPFLVAVVPERDL